MGERVSRKQGRADKMARWGKAPAARLDDLSSVPRIHRVEREDPLLLVRL